jgi:hypothetical protein
MRYGVIRGKTRHGTFRTRSDGRPAPNLLG